MSPGRINERARLCSRLRTTNTAKGAGGRGLVLGQESPSRPVQPRAQVYSHTTDAHAIRNFSQGCLDFLKQKGSSVTVTATLSASCVWSRLWVVDPVGQKNSFCRWDSVGGHEVWRAIIRTEALRRTSWSNLATLRTARALMLNRLEVFSPKKTFC